MSEAKALALAWDVPFVAVNHLEGHLFAALLDHSHLDRPIPTGPPGRSWSPSSRAATP